MLHVLRTKLTAVVMMALLFGGGAVTFAQAPLAQAATCGSHIEVATANNSSPINGYTIRVEIWGYFTYLPQFGDYENCEKFNARVTVITNGNNLSAGSLVAADSYMKTSDSGNNSTFFIPTSPGFPGGTANWSSPFTSTFNNSNPVATAHFRSSNGQTDINLRSMGIFALVSNGCGNQFCA